MWHDERSLNPDSIGGHNQPIEDLHAVHEDAPRDAAAVRIEVFLAQIDRDVDGAIDLAHVTAHRPNYPVLSVRWRKAGRMTGSGAESQINVVLRADLCNAGAPH